MKSQLEFNIAIIGLGYVGLPLACLCAKKGYSVTAFDTDRNIIDDLNRGISPIKHLDNEEWLVEACKTDRFFATSEPDDLNSCNCYIVCVPTPINIQNEPDLSYLEQAILTIAPRLKQKDLVIIESTVFPGTCESVIVPLIEKQTGLKCDGDISLVHCPERVNPGDSYWNSQNIPRVLGSTDGNGSKQAASLYSAILGGPILQIEEIRNRATTQKTSEHTPSFNSDNVPLGSITVMRSIRDAEAVKAMENTVRDVNIAFVNELAKISEVLNLDVVDIIDGMSTKPFGKGPFYPGIGVGGHCIAVDPEWLKSASIHAGYSPELIEVSRKINVGMPEHSVSLLKTQIDKLGFKFEKIKVAILGVAYKANVGDTRESPFYAVKKQLVALGTEVTIFDSWVKVENTHETIFEAIAGCTGLIIVTDHRDMIDELISLDLYAAGIRVVLDGRNCISNERLDPRIIYQGIGRR